MVPRNVLQRKELTVGGNLFLRLGQCMSVDEVFEDLTSIAAEKEIYVDSIILMRQGLKHEFKPAKVGARDHRRLQVSPWLYPPFPASCPFGFTIATMLPHPSQSPA